MHDLFPLLMIVFLDAPILRDFDFQYFRLLLGAADVGFTTTLIHLNTGYVTFCGHTFLRRYRAEFCLTFACRYRFRL